MLTLRAAGLGLAAAWLAVAQTNVSSGELRGIVTDPGDALVATAKVTVQNPETGLVLSALTDGEGEYRILLLPPGDYSVTFEKENFRTKILTGVRITVGQTATLDTRLELGVSTQKIEVSAAPNLVEVGRVQQANTIEREAIENLPIDRRDYLTYTLLAPGVVDSTALADNYDFRVKQTPQTGLSFYGSNGRGNSITVDGGEMGDAGGGVRTTLSQEAVQEFQINRSNYAAELGQASGGVINIVSKSGGNQVTGSLFGFFRHQSMDAADPFARVLENGSLVRIKPPSHREQFGASLGMPLQKNRLFLFAAGEGLIRNESSVVSLLTDTSIFQPTPDQNAVLSALPAAIAAPLRAALTASPATVALFENNSGPFPFTTHAWKASLRLDYNASERERFFLRQSYSDTHESNANLQALVAANRGTVMQLLDPTSVGGWTHIFSPALMNEFQAQWAYRGFNMNSIDKLGPEIRIAGYGVFNRDLNLPSMTIERRTELRDSMTKVRNNHTFKWGGDVLIRGINTRSDVFFPGRFTFGALPGAILNPALPSTFSITGLQAYNLGLAQTYLQGFGDPAVKSTNPYYAFFAQDSWKLRPNLTLDLGVRYDLDTRNPPLRTDHNNWAPRIGLAWDPFRDGKTTVRGGYGIFYSPIYYQIDWVVRVFDTEPSPRQMSQVFTTILDSGPAAAPNVYSTLRAEGIIGTRSIHQSDLTQFGISFPLTGPIPPLSVLFSGSPDYVNPYSQQVSFSAERQLSENVAVSAGYVWVRTRKLPRSRDKNLLTAPVDPQLGIRVWSDPLRGFVNPLIAQDNVYESTANANYRGLILELKKRFGHSFSLGTNYTYSRAEDDVVDFSADFQASDQSNQQAEHALSSFDERHKFVAYGMWKTVAGIQLSPIFRANSGRPFNLLVGYDLNQDRHDNSDRPPGAGRNTGIGPNFWTFDLRVEKTLLLNREKTRLELMAEGFNIANRLNFASINNVVGLIPGPFNLEGRSDRSPSEPLGFTSAFSPRRIQLGVRLRF